MYEANTGGDYGMWFWIITFAVYFYFAFAQYKIAEKIGTPNAWFSFVPILNLVLLIQMAQRPMWWFILLLVPVINVICYAIIWMDVAKNSGSSPVLGFCNIIPFLNLITIGMMAFGGSSPKQVPYPSHDEPAPKQPEQVG
jgi:hypothetical protein